MENKKIKLLMLSTWDLEEQVSWFSDMSLQGWKLIAINNVFATFERCEPKRLAYRCDVFKLSAESYDHKIKIYKDSGWEYIGSRNMVQIFREIPGQCCSEVHTDPNQLVENVSVLNRSIHFRGILTIASAMLLIFLNIAKLGFDPVRNYLDDTYIESILFVGVYLFLCYMMVKGMLHTSQLLKKLKSGSMLDHNIPYKRKWTQNKWVNIGVSCILFIWLIKIGVSLYTTLGDRFPPIPEGELPVVQMSDFLDPADFEVDEEARSNYYFEKSSWLVPEQYELKQVIRVPEEILKENSDAYNLAIYSYRYNVRTEWIAKAFLKDLKEKQTSYDEKFEEIKDNDFDELWVSKREGTKSSFISRKDDQIYYVVHFGMEPIEEIIHAAYKKATSDTTESKM